MSAIILDFDGTIADSFDYILDFLLHEKGLKLSAEQRLEYRNMTMFNMAYKVGYRWWQMPRLYFRARHVMFDHVHKVPLHDGMGKVINQLHAEGHELFILSSNSTRNIRAFLGHHGLNDKFLGVYATASLLGKQRKMRRLLRINHLSHNDVISIGDEMRDVHAAHACDVRMLAVSWGFAARDELVKHCNHVADKPSDIIAILGSI